MPEWAKSHKICKQTFNTTKILRLALQSLVFYKLITVIADIQVMMLQYTDQLRTASIEIVDAIYFQIIAPETNFTTNPEKDHSKTRGCSTYVFNKRELKSKGT
jgi:hypothetical protein